MITRTGADRAPAVPPHRPSLVVAALTLGAAVQINNGFYHPAALLLVGASLVLGWAAVLTPRWLSRLVPDRSDITAAVLVVGVAVQLVVLMVAPIGIYLTRPQPARNDGFVPALILAAIAAGTAAVGRRRWRIAAAVVLVAVNAWLGVLTYRASPDPRIDVVTVHRAAFAALQEGHSPYSITYDDIYRGRSDFYPAGMTADGQVLYGYPYPPLSLVMAWSGELLGDFRHAELAALSIGGLSIAALGGFSAVAVLASAMLLFTPRVFFTLEQAWTEPLAIAWLAVGLYLCRQATTTGGLVAIGLAAATKQYMLVAVPLAWLLRQRPHLAWRGPVLTGAAAVAAIVPAVVWDARGFLHSAVMVQLRERLRHDALSFAVTYAHVTGTELPSAVYVTVVLAALALAIWRAPRTPAGFAAALAAVLLTAFATGKKAFCNYYFLVIAILAMTVAVAARPGDEDARTSGPQPARME